MLAKEKLTAGIYARNYLLQHQEITNLVGDRIYPGIAPEKSPSPFIVYERESYAIYNTKQGIYMQEAMIVFEVVSADFDTGMDIVVLIFEILHGKHGGLRFEVVDSAEYHKEGKFRQIIIFKIT